MSKGNGFGMYSIRDEDCILCASCSTLAPANFVIDLAAARLVRQPGSAEERTRCEAARLNCPAESIVVEE
jgi:ferredoxin